MKKTFIPISHRPKVKGMHLKEGSKHLSYTKNINNKTGIIPAVVLVGVYDDISQFRVIINEVSDEPLAVFFFDDLGIHWNFSFFDNELIFDLNGKLIKPLGIYYRGYGVDENDSRKKLFLNLQEAIELWEGECIGAKAKHYYNSSKGLQLTSTINQVLNIINNESVSFPPSFFIKGPPNLLQELLNKHEDLIVKSSSYVRSKVVNSNDFLLWESSNLLNLPTFFQVHIKGIDVRIHVLKDKSWAISIENKDGVDFRYAKNRYKYQKELISSLLNQFVLKLNEIEQIALSGIDIIKTEAQFFCLECNPNPGWAGFHYFSNDEKEIARSILKIITGKKKNECPSLSRD